MPDPNTLIEGLTPEEIAEKEQSCGGYPKSCSTCSTQYCPFMQDQITDNPDPGEIN